MIVTRRIHLTVNSLTLVALFEGRFYSNCTKISQYDKHFLKEHILSFKMSYDTAVCRRGGGGGGGIKLEIYDRSPIKDKKNISHILNDFYINIVERTTGKKPLTLSSVPTVSADEEIDIINCKYYNYPSMRKIRECFTI